MSHFADVLLKIFKDHQKDDRYWLQHLISSFSSLLLESLILPFKSIEQDFKNVLSISNSSKF